MILAVSLALALALAGPAAPETLEASATAGQPAAGSDAADTQPGPDETTAKVDPDQIAAAEAQRHFIEAKALFAERRYEDAAAEFRRSYVAFPTGPALYNMALAHEKSGDFIEAILAYEAYLQRPDLPVERGDQVRAVLDRLRERVGELSLAISPGAGIAEIRVDGKMVPESDFPLLVVPGEVVVELIGAKEGQRRKRTYRIEGGQRLQLDVVPFKEEMKTPREGSEASQQNPGPTPEVPKDPARLRPVFWALGGVSVAGGVGTVVFGAITKREERAFNSKKCPTVCDTPELKEMYPFPREHQNRAKKLQLATNITLGVSVAIGVAAVVVGAVAFSGGKRQDRRRAGIRLRLTASGVGLAF